VAAPIAAQLCPELKREERERLGGIEYMGIVCASLLLKQPLHGYYVTNITEDVPFTAVIEMSALVDRAELGGYTLAYLPKYVSSGDVFLSASDEEVRERFVPALLRMCPQLSESDILAFRVSREKYVMALPTLGYSGRLPAMTTSVPGLSIVNSAHIVNGTLNVNETLQCGERAVHMLLSQPARPAPGQNNRPALEGVR
jgi:protoporphyrinogen oxidase